MNRHDIIASELCLPIRSGPKHEAWQVFNIALSMQVEVLADNNIVQVFEFHIETPMMMSIASQHDLKNAYIKASIRNSKFFKLLMQHVCLTLSE